MDKLAQVRAILSLLLPSCGVVILMCFYLWLRRRQIKDRSLVWLCVCLVGVIPAAVVQILDLGDAQRPVTLMASSVSNILLAATAFQLLRVREAVRRAKYQDWARYLVWAVVAASAVICTLSGLRLAGKVGDDYIAAAALVDGMASCISVITLGLCMAYSFDKYGNRFMVGVTLVDFTYVLGYQLYMLVSRQQPPDWPLFIAFDITSAAFMTMIFIALALAWGLSSTSRLKFLDYERVDIVAMFIDFRGSTECAALAHDKGVSALVVEYTNRYCEWVMGFVSNAIDATPTVKFMGDGAAFVWEVPGDSRLIDFANAVVGLACALDGGYSKWRAENTDGMPEVPKYIGIGVDFGDASRLTSESGSYEYLGLPLSYAAKMQALARPNGGVVIRDKWTLPDYLRSKFTRNGVLTIGNECMPVRATGRVKFKSAKPAQQEAGELGLA